MSKFIAFEGIDASGKTTQSKLLAKYLKAEFFSFPNYRTTSGKLIKSYLKKEYSANTNERNNALIFQSLQYTNRLEAHESIFKALANNRFIVADRYSVSGEAYGKAEGLNPFYLKKLSDSLLFPDIQILIDIPVEESFRRRPNRQGDRYEEDIKLLKRVRNNYLKIFKERQNDRWCSYFIIDGTGTVEEVHFEIQRILDGIL